MRSTLLLIAAAALGCTLAAPAPMFAQVSELPPDVLAEEAPYRLVYDHVTATFRLLRPNGSQVAGWEASGQRALAPVPPDRPLEVVIENANTLLYTYEVTAEPVQGGRQVRACRDVGRSREHPTTDDEMVDDQHHRGANHRDEQAPQVEAGHAALTSVVEQRTADECAHDAEHQVDDQANARAVHDLAGDEPREQTEDEPTEDRH